jgi:hypothetical protein
MRHRCNAFLLGSALGLLVLANAPGQVVPDGLYYRFNEGSGLTTQNAAVPGVGAPTGNLIGAIGFGPGRFGSAISGNGAAGDYVQTNWTLNLQGLSWTIEFWFNPNATTTTLMYIFGVPVGGALRCFSGAVPGNGNLTFTGSGLTTVTITGAAPAAGVWTHIAYVFNNATVPPTITPYVNGVALAPVNQTGTITLANVGPFSVGAQLTGSAGLNGRMDDFRLWLRARTPAEIQAAYNNELYNENILAGTTSGGGVGDLSLSLTSITAWAQEGYTLISQFTTFPAGSGPLLGIYPDGLTWMVFSFPSVAGSPFHFPVGLAGTYPAVPFVVPPGTLSNLAGTSLDAVTLLLGPNLSYAGASNAIRLNF